MYAQQLKKRSKGVRGGRETGKLGSAEKRQDWWVKPSENTLIAADKSLPNI
jgi:hypothetical protein